MLRSSQWRIEQWNLDRLEEEASNLHSFCMSLSGATHVVQWGGSDVYKVGGKVFAILIRDPDGQMRVTFKASPMSFEMLKSVPGMRPAPYLVSRGLKWLQWLDESTLDRQALRDYVRRSHAMAMDGLSKAKRMALQSPPSA
jgi:predicted DNA-binding protein (MmcQ/YjbR family)